ncbi:MAG: prolyl oligopeptidase family serine peptidase [Acidobacteriota bacterium]
MGLLRAVCAVLCGFVPLAAQAPRPIAFSDFDAWRSIQSQQLSRDGRYLAYALMPQSGDGEAVLRELATGRESRIPIGAMPPPATDGEGDDPPPAASGPRIDFSADGRYLFLTSYPPKAATQQAKRDKKPAPSNGLVLVEVASGQLTRIEDVQSFAFPEEVTNAVAYRRSGKGATELVVRSLPAQSERQIADVTEYSFTRDGQLLAIATKDAVKILNTELQTITTAPGAYAKLTWDEAQTQLAFVTKQALFGGKRGEAMASEWRRASISDRANLQFSRDGARVFFSTVLPRPQRPEPDPAEERAVFDLWHYQDGRVPTIQKARAEQERNRSYRAVFHIAARQFVQLATPDLLEVTPSEDGLVAVGIDDQPYRRENDYNDRQSDFWLLNTTTGERARVVERAAGTPTLSPDGQYAAYYTAGHWWVINVATKTAANLTAHLPVRFRNELHDTPGAPISYGQAGWTADSRHFLVYDRYDLWALAPDAAATSRNLTEGEGRRQRIQFRLVRLRTDPRRRHLDPAEPLLLRAENELTRQTGFYRDSFTGEAPPRKILMAAKNFRAPVQARNADVLLLSASTFTEYPDLLVTNASFTKLDKVTRANPQQAQMAWGTAELLPFTNLNGVPLHSVLIKPPGFDPTRKYPLMVYLYERLSQTLHTFYDPAPSHRINPAVYASNGYVVLLPDIAYTIGYPGQSALNAVLPAVQKVADAGYIDEARIGIQGHSWGGYQIAYLLTKTNRFRAAAPGALVGNMFAAYSGIRYGTGIPRQFQYERTQSRIGGTPWEYPLRFLENSPVFTADRVETPVLMLHNDADDDVPWTQGIEFFLALRRLNKAAYFFNYNGEPHGIRKRANQMDYALRLFQFFNHFLRNEPKPKWMQQGIPYLERDLPEHQATSVQSTLAQ